MRFLHSVSVFAFLSLLFLAAPASADRWDSRGWVKLGERTVNGRVDRDQIAVGRYEGTFSKLTLVVENSDLELLDFEVTFGNGEKWSPGGVHHYFRESSRTRVIDLPGDKRIIKTINLKYKNIPGGGAASVEVWGWKAGNAAPLAKPPAFRWDSTGWQLLGQRTVNGRADHDRIDVGSYKGTFRKLALVVIDSDIELVDLEIKFGRGAPWHPGLKHYFRENDRSRVIDFPGDQRVIKFIDFKYRNLPGGGAAKVQVWAR